MLVILCPDNVNQPSRAGFLKFCHSICCPSFIPQKSKLEQLKAAFSSVRVIKEALNYHIPFLLLLPKESNIPAQKPGHIEEGQQNQLSDKGRGTQSRVKSWGPFAIPLRRNLKSLLVVIIVVYHYDELCGIVYSSYFTIATRSSQNHVFCL